MSALHISQHGSVMARRNRRLVMCKDSGKLLQIAVSEAAAAVALNPSPSRRKRRDCGSGTGSRWLSSRTVTLADATRVGALAGTRPDGEGRTGFPRQLHPRLVAGVPFAPCRRPTVAETALELQSAPARRPITEQERQRSQVWCRPAHPVGFGTKPHLVEALTPLVSGKP